MSTNLTGRTGVVIDLKNVNDLDTKLADILDELGVDTSIKWSFGPGIKACNVLFHSKRTITGGQSEKLSVGAKAEGSEYEFDNDAHQYGIKAIRNVGYGYWQYASHATLVTKLT